MTQDFDWSSVGTPVESGSGDWSSVASPVGETPKQNKGIVADTITDLKRGVQGIPGIATGLADMQTAWLTGDTYANKAADYLGEITGFQPSKWANEASKEYSPARQASSLAVSKARDDNDSPFVDAMHGDFSGIGNIAKAYIQNPLHTIGSVVESLPSMALGGLAGRGVGIATKISPAISGALGEGMVMSGQQMNQLTEAGADPRLSAAASLATGLFGAGVGALGGKLSHHLGVVDPDTAMAGGAIRGVTEEVGDRSINGIAKVGARHVADGAKRVAGGAFSEGFFEELPQSVLEQALSNLAQGKPWDEGVSHAAVEGTLAGSLMGGAFNVLPPSVQAPGQQPQSEQNQNPMLALPAPTYTGTPGNQITSADVDRQAAIDKAQAESDAIWAARDEYERQQKGYKTRPAPTITTDPEPIQQRIDALFGINQQRLSGIARSNYEKALDSAFNEQIGFVSGKNSAEIPFTMGDYLKSKVAAADIARDKPKADAANQNALNRLGQLDAEETQQVPDIPVVGPLSFAANNAVKTGVSEIVSRKQAASNAAQGAVETNPMASAAGVVAPNIAPQAPSITAQAPSIEGDSNASKFEQVAQEAQKANDAKNSSFDVSTRTDKQLEHLTNHGQPGWKEAAVAELQKRGVQVSAPQQAKTDTLSAEKTANPDKPVEVDVDAADADENAPLYGGKYDKVFKGKVPSGWYLVGKNTSGNNVYQAGGARIVEDGEYFVQELPNKPREDRYAEFKTKEEIEKMAGRNTAPAKEAPNIPNGDGITSQPPKQQSPAPTEKPKAKHPLSVGFMPGAADPITVKDGVVYIGKYPAQNFDTGEDVIVPAGATDKQVVSALKDAGAISNKQKVFGLEKEAAKPAEDTIGWTRMTTVEREGVLRRAGYEGANNRLNLSGAKLAKTPWESMSQAVRDKLIAAHESRYHPAKQDIDSAANEAATSEKNDTPAPTEAQQEAGNYKKGHLTIQGLNIAIENPEGSKRSGTDEDGKAWETTMAAHYGYIKRTEGNDGDHVDVYVGPAPDSNIAFVVDQSNADGSFDEHKVLIGFPNALAATRAYAKSYEPGWMASRVIAAEKLTIAELKDWLKNGDMSNPYSSQKANQNTIKNESPDAAPVPEESKAPEQKPIKKQDQSADAISFVRRGDFWNYSGERAKEVAKAVGLVATTRNGIPEVGIADHQREQISGELKAAGIDAVFAAADATSKPKTDEAPEAEKNKAPAIGSKPKILARMRELYQQEIELNRRRQEEGTDFAEYEAERQRIKREKDALSDEYKSLGGQDKEPTASPQHVENGKAETATTAVVEQSLKKGATNSQLDLRQERDLLLKKIDAAIAAAPTASEKDAWDSVNKKIDLKNNMHVDDTIGYRGFDVPGDGKFKVLNLKEALQRFRDSVESNPGFKKPANTTGLQKVAPWQRTTSGGSEAMTKELLEDGEYSAAVEYAKQIGKPLVFGQYQDGSAITVYTESKSFEHEGYDDFNMVSARNPGAADKVAWAVIDLNSGLTISSQHPTRLKAIAETHKALDKMTPDKLAMAVRSAKASNGAYPVGTQEELEQRWLENVDVREAQAQGRAEQEHRKGLRSHRGMLADHTGNPVEEDGKPANKVEEENRTPRERGVADFVAGRERIIPDDLRNDQAIEYNLGYAEAKNESDYLKSREGKDIVVMPSEFPLREVDASYSHISHNGTGRARGDRDAFVETVNGLYDAAMAKAETDEQKAAAKRSAIEFKDEYLRRLQSVIRVRGQTYSGFVAGRAKLNAKQSDSRNDALSRAIDTFASWQRGAEPKIMQAVLDARNDDQRAAEQQAKDEKAAKKKADLHSLLGKLMDFKKGDSVKFGAYPVAKVSLDKAGYPSSVTVDATDLTDNKFDVARLLFDGDKDKLRAAVDEIRAAHPTSAEQAPADNQEAPASLVDQVNAAVKKLFDGELTVDELKSAFALARDNRAAIEDELSKFKKDELLRSGGPMFGYRYKSETKPEIVKASYAAMLDNFIMGESISYAVGGGTDWVETKAKAIAARVDAATPESLVAYADKIKANRAEREQRREESAKAMADPQTLEDYRRLLQAKVDGGKTSDQARMELTPEQRVALDNLWADDTRSRRSQRNDAAKTEVRVAAKTTDGDIIETKHTKTGADLFVVKAAERVERDVYNQWNAAAKKLGGWYSSFRGNGAVPGFQFKTRDDAAAFLQYLGGDATAAQEAVQEKRDAFADDRSQSAAERLNEMADRLDERADESLAVERKANTARRARFAASAEAAASSDKALAKTMRNISEAIATGKAKFLDRVRQKAQVEMLRSTVKTAQYAELQKKYPSYAEQERHRGEKPGSETADYARWPTFTADRADLARLGRDLLQIDGAKLLGQRILKVADDVTDAYQKFAKENLYKVSIFSKSREGSDTKEMAVFGTADAAERAIARSGFKGKATTVSFKRGEHLVIMGPEMAREAGVWQGDPDKRITLTADAGEEIVAKVKALGKGKVAMPYVFENVATERARWKALGIETAAEQRAALREFIALQEAPSAPDRIKQMERAMIGRANDGLDFFPTPAETAQAMIDAAEIKEGMSVLEPSAGWGHIAEKIRDVSGVDPDVIEFSPDRRELLEAKGFNVVGQDFMDLNERSFTYGDVFRDKNGVEGIMRGGGGLGSNRVGFIPLGKDERQSEWRDRDELEGVRKNGFNSGYDRIVMNPPFSNRRDAEHVQHAYSLLKPGGRLVAIMGEGVFYGQDKKAQAFRDWLEEVGGTSEKLEAGTFMDSSLPVNTGVNARMVVVDKATGKVAPEENEGVGNVAEDDGIDFTAEVLNELSFEDEAFRYAISSSKTLQGNLKDALPGVEYLGEDTRPDERQESGADRRFVFAMPQRDQRLFYVFERGDEVWFDVSRLQHGDQGSAIYHGVANYAHNTGKVFIGDPMGLSEDAVIRRTSAMLSSALRFGTTKHLGASREQIKGDAKNGIEPLDWSGDDVAKTRSLIHTFITTLHNQFPGIKEYRYDFNRNEFVRKGDDESGFRESGFGPLGGKELLGRIIASGAGGDLRKSRAGEATLRRGIFLQSIVAAEGSEQPGLLENVLRRSSQLVKEGGPLRAVFNKQQKSASVSTADKSIYGMAAEGKSATEILKFIASASRNPFYRQLAKLLQKTGTNPSITVGDGKNWKMNAGDGNKYAAGYNPKTDTVALFRPAAAERNMLHELVHAATLKALANGGIAAAQMRELYRRVKKTGKLKGMYGMSDVDEFVAEAFSNPKFQDRLKSIAAPAGDNKLSTAWDWFIRVVRGILGLPENRDSALSRAIEIGLGVMREDMKLRNAEVGVPFAEITGKEIDSTIGRNIQEKATNWMRRNMQGKSFKNDATGWDVSVGRKGVNKAMSHGAKETHSRSVAAIPALLKNAVLVSSESNKNSADRMDVAMVHHFYAPFRMAGSTYVARMVVKETRSGQKFYDYDTSDVISPTNQAADAHLPKEGAAAQSAGRGMSMSELLSYVKAEHGGTDPRFVRYNIADEGWEITEPSKMDDVIYSLQDKHIDLKRVVQSISASGKKIRDNFNPYLQEELFHGRAAKGVKDFLDFELRPLLKEMQGQGVDMGDFEEYLWNRHAEERNKQIAKINPDMPDGGSGIDTADARAYMDGLSAENKAKYEALAKRIDAINRNSQGILVSSGLESQDTIAAWNGAYKNYVPLQREDVDSGHVGTGKGFSVRGSSTKRAMGSGKKVVNIIANLTMQRERNIVRAEKNRVSNALLGLAMENPNPDFWTVDKTPKERVVEERAIYTVRDAAGKKLEEFTRMDEAERFARQHPDSDIEQTWGDRVTERVTPGFTSRDNVLLTRVNGKDHYITFNERDDRAMRMAQAMKNLDVDSMGRVLSIVGKATRYLSSINTQYNPVFGVINLIRDAQGALINLTSTPLAGDQKKVLGYTASALRGIYSDIRAHRAGKVPSSSWSELFEEFQSEGGQTGYRDQYDNAEARSEAIKSELEQFKEGKAKKFTRGLFGWLSDYNETMENAVRLAAYKAAKEKGMSRQQAASLAKNITVNFNRKGQMATQIGALYAFFNASVQGTARIAETLFDVDGGDWKTAKLSKAGKRIVVGGIMLGSMQALLLAAAGYDDDEPPDFVRERNLILPIGDGKYLTLAMPLGFHVIPGIGRILTEFVISGGKNPAKKIGSLLSMFAEAFNPIGNSGFSLQTITPSVVDPFAALAENKDFTGKEIYRENFNSLNPQPGHARAKDSATIWSKFISEVINSLTGGSEFKPGMASPSPDAIDYLIGQATGGVGRELSKAFQTAESSVTGEDLPIYKVPLVGRFVGDTKGQSGESAKFYETIKQINMHEAEYKGLIKAGRRDEAAEYLAENPMVKMMLAGNAAETQVRKLKTAKRDLLESGADPARVSEIEHKITNAMRSFNERVGKFERLSDAKVGQMK